jgi:putative transcriptional regulator
MKTKRSAAFAKISAGLEDAIAHRRGQRTLTVRDVELHRAPQVLSGAEVAQVRAAMHVSQAAFARLLNVSPRTVQAWESSARTPSAAALKLLHVAKRHPEVLFE